jgi:hypothetical protein
MNSDIKTRELGRIEIFKLTIKVVVNHIVEIALVALGAFVPLAIIQALLVPPVQNAEAPELYFRALQWYQWSGLAVTLILTWPVTMLVTVIVAYIVEGDIENRPVVWQEALQKGFARWGLVVGTGIIFYIIQVAATVQTFFIPYADPEIDTSTFQAFTSLYCLGMVLLIPGVILAIYLLFWVYAVALREQAWLEAFKYSWRLVRGRWWRIFSVLLNVGFLIGLIIGIPFCMVTFYFGTIFPSTPLATTFQVIMTGVQSAVLAVLQTILFLNEDYLRNKPAATSQPGAVSEAF